MNLALALGIQAERDPQKTAIFYGDSLYNFEWVGTQARRLAAVLAQSCAVRPGDRVGLWLKNCPEFVPAIFGVFSAGAAAVPINNFFKPDEVAFILQDAGINVLIVDASVNEGLAALRQTFPELKVWNVEEFAAPALAKVAALPIPERTEKDLAVLIYTSGTTGKPKGAMLTHGNLLANVESCRLILETIAQDRFVLLLPMFHSFMLTVCVLLPMLTGASIVLIRSVHPAKSVLGEILQHRATILPAVPAFFRLFTLAELPPNLPLRLCISGGAALPVEILREFTAKYPYPLIEGYGLSETSPVASLTPLRGPWKAGSIGVPIPQVEMSVQNEAGELLPAGETGEICIRGSNVMAGYWNQPQATAEAMRHGWFLTGDIGHRDADGFYYITDRKKDMLIVNGINVYPRQIEEVIYQFPGVKEAAVIGVPDARRGEQPLAYVALKDGAAVDEKALLQFIKSKVADYKVPRRVVVLPALPRNATGKILKTELRQLAAGAHEPAA